MKKTVLFIIAISIILCSCGDYDRNIDAPSISVDEVIITNSLYKEEVLRLERIYDYAEIRGNVIYGCCREGEEVAIVYQKKVMLRF